MSSGWINGVQTGDTHQSIDYNEVNVQPALDKIADFRADMGSTNLGDALEKAAFCKDIAKEIRVFMLTDGDADNKSKV